MKKNYLINIFFVIFFILIFALFPLLVFFIFKVENKWLNIATFSLFLISFLSFWYLFILKLSFFKDNKLRRNFENLLITPFYDRELIFLTKKRIIFWAILLFILFFIGSCLISLCYYVSSFTDFIFYRMVPASLKFTEKHPLPYIKDIDTFLYKITFVFGWSFFISSLVLTPFIIYFMNNPKLKKERNINYPFVS
ncbi:Uncharacterised protein (plasmid) [Mycoplasmopsis gallopavonis]|uniref:Uncharacterized protein n=1 Tax=Mycoplasmopsis gallopavonis TaxID=76629 RepID=A0A449B0H7_9BACT|nr:Uncharacterised protein [Mycoplasmopsis gallopavonis]